MNNTQLYLAIVVPSVLVILSWIDSHKLGSKMDKSISELRGEMNMRFERVETKQDRMQADLSQFYRTLGQHEKAIDVLEKK